MAKKKTLGQVMQEIQELEERSAVHKALSSYLRTRYLPRDSISAQAKISCAHGAVSEGILNEVAQELEEGAEEMDNTLRAYKAEEVNDG